MENLLTEREWSNYIVDYIRKSPSPKKGYRFSDLESAQYLTENWSKYRMLLFRMLPRYYVDYDIDIWPFK